jgi:predicted enzyme related to lactoylglutathione lyase
MAARVQLALNVSDIDQAVAFYEKLFRTPPAKREPGYANFAVTDPPLKLVLIENTAATSRLNHLGIEVFASADVQDAQRRLAGQGLPVVSEENVSCCYAIQDKVWVTDPDGASWETYVVLDHTDTMGASPSDCRGAECCA